MGYVNFHDCNELYHLWGREYRINVIAQGNLGGGGGGGGRVYVGLPDLWYSSPSSKRDCLFRIIQLTAVFPSGSTNPPPPPPPLLHIHIECYIGNDNTFQVQR